MWIREERALTPSGKVFRNTALNGSPRTLCAAFEYTLFSYTVGVLDKVPSAREEATMLLSLISYPGPEGVLAIQLRSSPLRNRCQDSAVIAWDEGVGA